MYIAFLEVLQTDGSRESYFGWVGAIFGGHLASLCIAATPRVARSLSLSRHLALRKNYANRPR